MSYGNDGKEFFITSRTTAPALDDARIVGAFETLSGIEKWRDVDRDSFHSGLYGGFVLRRKIWIHLGSP